MGRAVQFDAILSGVIDPNTGLPASGGTIYFYASGTTTGKNVWTEAAKSNAYTYYTLDSAGSAQLYGDGIYDVVVKNSSGTTIYEWDGVRLRYPDYQVTTVSTNYSQVSDDDAIVVSADATSAVEITLLDTALWEDKPLVVHNANATYSVIVSPPSGTIDGGASKTLGVGSSSIKVFCVGSNFYTSGGATGSLMSTDESGRSVEIDEYGAYDESPDFESSFYLLGHPSIASRIICARIDLAYSAASQISATLSSLTSYGFARPGTVASGGLAAGGSANGFTVGSSGEYLRLANTIAYTESADSANFVGVFPSNVPIYDLTTSGVPSIMLYYSSSALTIYYYEDGAAGNLISALATSGDDMSFIVMYAMSPVP